MSATTVPAPRTHRIGTAAGAVGGLLALIALVLIWSARLQTSGTVYVSGLGADGAPTAARFELALLALVGGAGLVACALGRGTGDAEASRGRGAATWLGIAAGAFLLTSQVPCTAGCPLPAGENFWQDLVHTSAAVLGFAAAAVAMLVTATGGGPRRLRLPSLLASVLVAVVAAGGGLLSLLGVATDWGSRMELLATTVGVLWLAGVGLVVAADPASDARVVPGR